jgi:hypothetical protein
MNNQLKKLYINLLKKELTICNVKKLLYGAYAITLRPRVNNYVECYLLTPCEWGKKR